MLRGEPIGGDKYFQDYGFLSQTRCENGKLVPDPNKPAQINFADIDFQNKTIRGYTPPNQTYKNQMVSFINSIGNKNNYKWGNNTRPCEE